EPPGKRRTLLEQRPEVTLDLIVMVPWEDQQRSMHPRSATIPRPVRSRRSPCLTPASMTPAPPHDDLAARRRPGARGGDSPGPHRPSDRTSGLHARDLHGGSSRRRGFRGGDHIRLLAESLANTLG